MRDAVARAFYAHMLLRRCRVFCQPYYFTPFAATPPRLMPFCHAALLQPRAKVQYARHDARSACGKRRCAAQRVYVGKGTARGVREGASARAKSASRPRSACRAPVPQICADIALLMRQLYMSGSAFMVAHRRMMPPQAADALPVYIFFFPAPRGRRHATRLRACFCRSIYHAARCCMPARKMIYDGESAARVCYRAIE